MERFFYEKRMHPFWFRVRLMRMNDENMTFCKDQSSSSGHDATDDLTLVVAAQVGDMHAFSRLVERHTERIYGLALRMLGNAGEAEDATQEAFIRAYSHLAEFRNKAAFATWLYRIALNICRDQLRRQQAREHYAEIWRVHHLWADEHYSVDPERVTLALENRRMLNVALEQLPATYRATILLHDVDGLTISEVATLMDVPLPTAKSRLRRARMTLVTLLDEYTRKEDSQDRHSVPSQDQPLLEKGGAK